MIAVVGLLQQYPRGKWPSRQQALSDFAWGLPALSIPVIIIGGIVFGIATPTESAALASLALP